MISAWQRGVNQYAKELKREFRENYGRQKNDRRKTVKWC